MKYYRVLNRARRDKETVGSASIFREAKELRRYLPRSLVSLKVIIMFLESGNNELSNEELSRELGIEPKYLRYVVSKLVSTNIIEYVNGKYRLSSLGKSLINRLVRILS